MLIIPVFLKSWKSTPPAPEQPEAQFDFQEAEHDDPNMTDHDGHGTHQLPASTHSLNKSLLDDWTPYRNRIEFETAEFFFTENQTPAAQINKLLDLWASTLQKHGDKPPFADFRDLHKTIDKTPLGDVKWQSFSVRYNGERPAADVPPWMDQDFDVWYRDPREVVRNMLANPDYIEEFDYRPYREFLTDGDERQWRDFMSGDWVWDQADIISEDPESHGSTFVPVILGSDKTTVSVATGNNEYYPLYASIGNVRNNVRRAHRDAVSIIGFLAIPKTTKEHATGDVMFRKFRRQLFHCSLSKILETLRPGITKYEVARFGDGHFRRVIYGLGPYIADYEEQVLLTCIVRGWCPRPVGAVVITQMCLSEGTLGELWDEYGIVGDLVPFTNDFPRADIHELIAPDILHQLIKGTFKDHLVEWVEKYLYQTHSKKEAQRIMDDIDRRIAAVPAFAGLRRFPQGRGFKQWTGDDSKALMKVYLSAIEGHVPVDIVRTFRAFLDFCYFVRRSVITEKTLKNIQEALDRFHRYRQTFETIGVVSTFSLPRQHSLQHYVLLIRLFGAPNGLCSSITEAKHIKAVKEPWRRSSRYKALGQMLVTNQRLDKLAASRADFTQRKMLDGTCLSAAALAVEANDNNNDTEVDDGPTNVEAHVELAKTPQRKRARTPAALAVELAIPQLPNLLRRFLFTQLNPDDPRDPSEVPLTCCPQYNDKISVFNSACSRFFAPSDPSGIGGMRREYVRACPIWRNEYPRYDCVFVNTNPDLDGMRGMDVARVLSFFSFTYKAELYPCAVVRWFDTIGDSPNEDNGMWMVQPAHHANNSPHISIIHIDSIYRAAHLIPIYGTQFIPPQHQHHQTYDVFRKFYVNKYADHHAFEIAF
ncbi:hypothetical protein DEU56DRAFT_975209 [Suillus clintonianus]|uniref:uncharacterized protein n=1 Tax=Suillus clintonianus TaxID=1904413 RepID=UPI001B8632CB|nr:uncharacterized protein DEU56DRAFT_975209 [Suillus clintonianus]KAG2109141.1 hypothetical protein DEU56DRAFT_975209 [Suillus clintonianus]